jgi:quinohemoprotein ethanol dehydrogenase
LTEEKHHAFRAFLSGARMYRGMPSFADILEPEDMEQIRQYLIKRTHDLQAELNARTSND